MARQAGFAGELHLSTLANLSHPAGLRIAHELGANRVVIPRELNLDEAKAMADACPADLDLEIFVHGALCYSVSGRCWWSSYMGGKSGLRGRCVQPCRRLYTHARDDRGLRAFSCMDYSLDVLTKPLLDIPRIKAWKIEGRKKGPHYVYYTVSAYRLLRDKPQRRPSKKRCGKPPGTSLGASIHPFAFFTATRLHASGSWQRHRLGPAHRPHQIPR